MSATIERTFHLAPRGGRRSGWRQSVEPGPEPEPSVMAAPRIHPLARRMAMAITCQRLIRDGAAADAASLAAVAGVTRARMTQLLNFACLAPEFQAALLELPKDAAISERDLRPIMALLDWSSQREAWRRVASSSHLPGTIATEADPQPHHSTAGESRRHRSPAPRLAQNSNI